jgi:DegV family protein with EDD domain
MSKVAIVTDSTAYIPKDLLEEYNIEVVPQVLIWGEETYRDGVDIMPDEFYKRLEKTDIMPSSSQVSVPDFQELFARLHQDGREILTILISDALSGTIASAIQAHEFVPEARVEIVDSASTAMEMGFHVLAAARAAVDGATLEECKAIAMKAQQHSGVVFAVDTLDFLHRGGRIGGGKRFLGTVLNIKPILEVRDGRVEALESVRTRKKAINRLVEIVDERINGQTPIHLATLHANAESEAIDLLKIAKKRLGAEETILSEVSPVIGTHAGPGTVGLAYMAGM